jgi:hypothetical protein
MWMYARLPLDGFIRKRATAPVIGKSRDPERTTVQLYQHTARPETLFGHIYGEDEGFLVTFTGTQARLLDPEAASNELVEIKQRYWAYPGQWEDAAEYLLYQAGSMRDVYFGVHLFREYGNRRASNARPTVRCLWLDEDDGHFPDKGPEPTAIVRSSEARRHLYWRLTHPVAIEWAVAMNRRIAFLANGDRGKAGLASVLRAPGTKNFKRHPEVDDVACEISENAWDPEILDQAIPPIEEPSRPSYTGPYLGPKIDLFEFLGDVQVIRELPDGLGRKFQIICPWVSEHSDGDCSGTRVGQRHDGAPWFYCDHSHCEGRDWHDFKRVVRRSRSFTIQPPGATGPIMKVEVRYDR